MRDRRPCVTRMRAEKGLLPQKISRALALVDDIDEFRCSRTLTALRGRAFMSIVFPTVGENYGSIKK